MSDPQILAPTDGQKSGIRPRLMRWVFGLLVIGTLVFALFHFGDIEAFGQLIRRAHPAWLIAAALLQVGTYVAVSLGWKLVLREAGSPQHLRRLIPVAVTKLFADAIIPAAGMSGNVLLIDRLKKLGVPQGQAVAALLVSMAGFYAAYAVLAILMLLLLWLHDEATLLLSAIVTLFLFVALAIPGFALWLQRRGSHPLSPLLQRIPVVRSLLHVLGEAPTTLTRNRVLLTSVAGLSGLVVLIDAATLQACLFALDQHVSFGTAFIAMMAASIVVTLGPLPLGLGSFEAGSIGMLTLLRVPIEAALAGTLLLRAFTLWLPLLPGLILMKGSLRRGARRKSSSRRRSWQCHGTGN